MRKTILTAAPLAALLSLSCTQRPGTQAADITYAEQEPLNPPTYVCYKAPAPIQIDGKLSPTEWDAIPWTGDFVDIEGDKRPKPHFQTRAKMTYDDNGMYFAVLLEEPHVWANLTEHDAVIYQDNDFEIFLDPTNDTHNYLEYEVNALGTDWDLFLSRPYRDNPKVLNNWEFAGMKSAVYIDGTLNDPTDTDRSWSVEVFIPWASIFQVDRGKEKPEIGEQLRVNFSRVEWTTEVKAGKYEKVPIPGEDKIREYNLGMGTHGSHQYPQARVLGLRANLGSDSGRRGNAFRKAACGGDEMDLAQSLLPPTGVRRHLRSLCR